MQKEEEEVKFENRENYQNHHQQPKDNEFADDSFNSYKNEKSFINNQQIPNWSSFLYEKVIITAKFLSSLMSIVVFFLFFSLILKSRKNLQKIFSDETTEEWSQSSFNEAEENDDLQVDQWIEDCSQSKKIRSTIKSFFTKSESDTNRINSYLKKDKKQSENSHLLNRNFIFYGKPGTGKSHCALTIAKNISSYYTIIPGGSLQDKFVGSGATKWGKIISKAKENADNKKRPVVIVVEEIDSLAPSKNEKKTGFINDTLINTFLESIDSIKRNNLNIIIIGTTNVIESMEPAAVRAGRFNQLEFKYPNNEDVKEILKGVRREIENTYRVNEANNPSCSIHINENYWSSIEQKILKEGISVIGEKNEKLYPITFIQISSSVNELINHKIKNLADSKEKIIISNNSSVEETWELILAKYPHSLLEESKFDQERMGQEFFHLNQELIDHIKNNTLWRN